MQSHARAAHVKAETLPPSIDLNAFRMFVQPQKGRKTENRRGSAVSGTPFKYYRGEKKKKDHLSAFAFIPVKVFFFSFFYCAISSVRKEAGSPCEEDLFTTAVHAQLMSSSDIAAIANDIRAIANVRLPLVVNMCMYEKALSML